MKLLMTLAGVLVVTQPVFAGETLSCLSSGLKDELSVTILAKPGESHVVHSGLEADDGEKKVYKLKTLEVSEGYESVKYSLDLVSAEGAEAKLEISKTQFMNRAGNLIEQTFAKLLNGEEAVLFSCGSDKLTTKPTFPKFPKPGCEKTRAGCLPIH